MSSRHFTIEIVRTEGAQPWHVRIRAGNGEPWFSSEQYTRHESAQRSAFRLCQRFDCIIRSDGYIYSRVSESCVGRIVERDERLPSKRGAA